MKVVLQLTRDFPPASTGGLSTAVDGLVGALRNRGVKTTVLSFDDYRPARSRPAAFRVDSAGVARVSGPADLPMARKWALEQDLQLVHCHHSFLWAEAHELAEQASVKTLFFAHVVQAWLDRWRKLESPSQSAVAEQTSIAEADLVCAPSNAARLAIEELHPGSRVRVARLGVSDLPKAPQRANEKDFDLLYVGRFADVNGTLDFFRVARKLAQSCPSLRIAVAGGLPASGKAQRKWGKLADAELAQAKDKITFLGWLDRQALGRQYQGAKVLIAPSYFETFGQVVAEAMSFGLPVVTTDCGALPELIDPSCGRIVAAGDVQGLFSATRELLDSPAQASLLGQAARARIDERFRWETTIDDTLDVYRELGLTV